MGKQGKLLPARKPRENESLLLQSAETLGRMIGSLQRQLDDTTRRLSGNGAVKGRGSKSGATKTRSTTDRKSKASTSASASKTTGQTRSGASRRARKPSRNA